MASRDEIFTNKLFLNAVLPLIKVIASDVPSLAKKFEHAHGVMQVSALDPDSPDGKVATHFVVNCGEWLVHNDKVDTAPHIELEFKSIEAMNAFFKGKMSLSTLPKMKGIAKHPGLFASFMAVLLKMSSLLTAKGIPESEDTKALLVKCYFYLLSSGISQLNKLGHPDVHDWALKSPDRVYAWAVNGHDELSPSASILSTARWASCSVLTICLTPRRRASLSWKAHPSSALRSASICSPSPDSSSKRKHNKIPPCLRMRRFLYDDNIIFC